MLPSFVLAWILAFLPGGRVDQLADATRSASPGLLSAYDARRHAEAAYLAQRPGVSAELLLGVAYVETRYTEKARSAGGKGQYCGVVQATKDKDGWSCAELQTLRIGYAAGALSLWRWMKVCKRRVRCALRGYGGVSVNGAVKYPDRVLRKTKAIKRAMLGRRSDS